MWLLQRFVDLHPDAGHHGGCDGVDWLFHMLCRAARVPLTVHPASGTAARWAHPGALLQVPGVIVLPAKPPLERNHDIVDISNIMLVIPEGPEKDNPRSGTWATHRYAREVGIRMDVCFPNGTVVKY